MKNILFITLILIYGSASAQDFDIKRIELSGQSINVYYDLLDSVPNRTYTISLFSSKDNLIAPMKKVSGDLGIEVKPGQNKKIIWNAKEELGDGFEGKVALEVRGRVYVPFIKLDQLPKSIKRINKYELTWTGGTRQNVLNFELYKKDEKVNTFANIANVGQYTLSLPRYTKAGNDYYYFKITDSKNKDQVAISPFFSIKRKIPLIFKTLLFGGAVTIIAILVSKQQTTLSSIPDAPGHP